MKLKKAKRLMIENPGMEFTNKNFYRKELNPIVYYNEDKEAFYYKHNSSDICKAIDEPVEHAMDYDKGWLQLEKPKDTLAVTFSTPEELQVLWYYLNVPTYYAVEYNSSKEAPAGVNVLSFEMWKQVNEILSKHNLQLKHKES
jgi:hypothetical protein